MILESSINVAASFLAPRRASKDDVEATEDLRVRLQLGAQRAQENGAGQPPFAVDSDPQDLLVVVLELDPRAAVGHHLWRGSRWGLEGEETRPATGAAARR